MEQGHHDPVAILDALRDGLDWDDEKRSNAMDDLIARFPAESLERAIAPRLDHLGGSDGEVLIALVEGLARPALLDALADAVLLQPELAPDRLWLALEALEGSGRIEARPALVDLRDELDDLLGDDDSLAELAAQIGEDPDSIPLAIAALERVEPDLRAEIIAGLGEVEPSPALIGFLEALARVDDPIERAEAVGVLRRLGVHGGESASDPTAADATGEAGRVLACLVGDLDADGRARVVFLREETGRYRVSLFLCDVRDGLVGAEMKLLRTEEEAEAEWSTVSRDVVAATDRPALAPPSEIGATAEHAAVRLVSGAAWLSGESLSDGRREALRATFGPSFESRPIPSDGAISTAPSGTDADFDAAEDARLVLDRCPGWLDDSDLVRGLAVEMAYRGPGEEPDPGPHRVLFEGRILGRIDLYRRMLLWSALVWADGGESRGSAAASRLAAQLGDPQHAVPGHPFLAELMARSLAVHRP